MRTRTRNLRGLLVLLREFGVTSYDHAGTKLTMVAQRQAAEAQPATPQRKAARPTAGPDDALRAMMDAAGQSDETIAELRATLGMGS